MPRRPLASRTTLAAWRKLERELGRVLALMGDGEWQYLILSDPRTERYVQFAVQAGAPLRAEAVGNDHLSPEHALGPAQVKVLLALGWQAPPVRTKVRANDANDFSREFERPVDHAEVATLAVRTLRDVYQTPFPARLEYEAFERGGTALLLPTLELLRRRAPAGAMKQAPASPPRAEVRRQVRDALRASSGIGDLDFDDEGDLTFRYGSAYLVVRLHQEPDHACVFSPLVLGVTASEALTARLAELNRRVKFARFFQAGDRVVASLEVFTHPLVTEHLVAACEVLGDLVSSLDGELAREFGGKVAFEEEEENEKPAPPPLLPEGRTPKARVRRPVGFRVT